MSLRGQEQIWTTLPTHQVLKFENLIQIWNSLLLLKIYFKHGPWEIVPCGCIQVYHVIRVNIHTLHHFAGSMFKKKSVRIKFFQISNKLSNFKTRFEISNKFKRIFQTEVLGKRQKKVFTIFWGSCVTPKRALQ